ncbi:LacI family DNA-binding transcriptional regulator [Actinocrinis puniceicyclus]|uniref:LacI family DNA-binding transcriptional regulator n=1 Tax=Actinocrinis puniceicyclus TaxID=977794 RepID=A0A8J8BDR3_9ACTN|nr:LacI family DNA-binding transcriptional regulator [Actinocrinis puniceicyclus]MBS2964750.1 LacI family DNA-binding transcriptional regulator [Actinocrinis puniceicyclus]
MVKARSRPGAAATTGAVTLSSVAERAGVSLATASRVLHGSGGRAVGDALRARVFAAAQQLGYVSNGPAQALARASSSVVGLVVHDVADPYFSAIAAGAMRVARAHDLMVMVAATFRDPELELEYLARLRAQRARAVLLAGSGFTDPGYTSRLAAQIEGFERQGGRVALVGQHGVPADAVLPGHREGAAEAARYLWELGHRRIAVVCGPRALETVAHRLDGIREALRGLGADLAERDVVEADFTRSGGRTATLELLRRNPGVTAILALNDLMAAGALAALREERRAVPAEVSVIGFDDLPQAADLHPALTTVRLPLEEIGERALRLILEEEPGYAPRAVPVPATLVMRASTGPAPR